jgi:transposase
MKQYKWIFGVDISKRTIDVTLVLDGKQIHRQFQNDGTSMEDLMNWFSELNLNASDTLFCMEATGLYCFALTQFLVSHAIDVWIEHAAQIKNATALNRGKNDKTDSGRIAIYATKNLDRLRLWKPAGNTIEKIKHLASLRERLVDTKKRLVTPIQEFEDVGNLAMAKLLAKSIKNSLSAIEKDLKNIEAGIIQIVNDDENLRQLYKLITSVVGIGFVTAINLIVYTNAFTVLKETRKLACYCGVAPFEYSSGSSIRGKTKVHCMANKKLKCNLHMASLSAIKLDSDLKAYYERKVAEGKNKMSVLNAVKNKLLARVVACVNNNREYVRKYV